MQPTDLTHLEKVEAALVALLKDRLGVTYYVDNFPDDIASFDTSGMEKVALVQYSGSRYGEATGTGSGAQNRRADFAIHLQFDATGNALRGAREVEFVRLAVQGQRIEGGDVQMLRDGLAEHDEAHNVWKYLVEIGISLPAVAMPRRPIAPFVTQFAQTGS